MMPGADFRPRFLLPSVVATRKAIVFYLVLSFFLSLFRFISKAIKPVTGRKRFQCALKCDRLQKFFRCQPMQCELLEE